MISRPECIVCLFKQAIVSKGQGNFESCCHLSHNIYFLLKAKCRVVAEELGVTDGDVVFKRRG